VGDERKRARMTVIDTTAGATADTDPVTAAPQLTLRARPPGYAVMQECLRVQSQAPIRTGWHRFWGRHPLGQEARSWFKGVLGERRVAAELARLGPAFTVLHAVPVGKGSTDIDHVVVGPSGVFTINTKNHSGQRVWVANTSFMVAGRKNRTIHASLGEGERATRLLRAAAGFDVPVQPLIVVSAERLTIRSAPAVPVLRVERVRRWLAAQPVVLAEDAVRYVASVAEDRATWHADAVALDDTLRMEQRFNRLEREIADARRRRLQVAGVVAIGVVGVPLGAAFLLPSVVSSMLFGS
jgi:hypothetical protein